MVYGKIPIFKVFNKPWHLTDQKHVNYLPWTHTSVTQFILCMISLMYVATIQLLNYSRQESKKSQFVVYISDTPPWNKVYLINLQKQGYDHAKCERSRFNNAREKHIIFFFSNKICQFFPWTCAKIKSSVIFTIYLT